MRSACGQLHHGSDGGERAGGDHVNRRALVGDAVEASGNEGLGNHVSSLVGLDETNYSIMEFIVQFTCE